MPGPLASVKFIHNAFRRDLMRTKSDIQFLATLGDGDVPLITQNFAAFNDFLSVHEKAEEGVLFPAIERVVPGAAQVYEATHREIDGMREGLLAALQAGDASKAFDIVMDLQARLTAHLDQEENELVPLWDEHFSAEDQCKLAGEMAQNVPPEQAAAIVPWMVRLLTHDDREGVMRMWGMALPAPAFDGIKKMVEGALKPDDWRELTNRMPELA